MESKNDKIDVSQIIALLRRNWWMFAISLVLCITFAAIYLHVKHSVYSVHAKVLVAYDDGAGSMGTSMLQSLSLGGVGGQNTEDEVIVMSSHSIKTQAIKDLKLNRNYSSPDGLLRKKYYYNNSPIEIMAPDELFDTLTVALKFNVQINEDLSKISVKVKKGRFKTITEVTSDKLPMVVSTPYGIYSIDTTTYYKPGSLVEVNVGIIGNSVYAESIAKNLTVEKTEKKASGISLFYEDINVQRGKDLLNKIIELYNRRGQKEKDEMAINTGKFIEERLDTLYVALSQAERNIQNYKQEKNIIDVASEAQYLMEKKGLLDEALISAEAAYEVLRMSDDFFKNPQNNYSMMPFSVDLPGIDAAVSAYNELIAKRMQIEANAKGDNPALKTIDAQIDEMRVSVKKSIEGAVASASVRLKELKSQESKSNNRLSSIPTQEREYIELQRDQRIKNQLYSYLLQRREENQLVLAATTPKGKIIDNAYAFNEPIAPNKRMIVVVALFLGLLIPMLIIYMKSLMNSKFDSIDALGRLTSLPVIGEICHARSLSENPIVVSETSTRPIAELFRLLRSNLQFMFPVKGVGIGQVAMVTSSCSGEGKTFVSMNVAESLALLGKKVVLVGMDIRLPMLAQNLRLPASPGVTNYLSGAIDSVDELVQRHANCDVIVAGPVPPNPSELLLNNRIERLVAELKQRYDFVIIDSAPIGMVSDTFSLGRFSDVTLYVSRANYTKKNFIKYLNSVVERGQLKNVAIVFNDTNPKLSYSYGYGYGYGYGAKDDD
ncbi:MAG: polysaccharide biosynthesis tyrosine autokinase [Muribaculaceae bacterium]|nr:polysaccharide biosynthesis tyrosine autokinase [Muribaculaceae bacterium]